MEEHGYEVVWLPEDLYFEGEGDALFARRRAFLRLQISLRHQRASRRRGHSWIASSSRSSWSIRAFITSIPAFVRLPDGGAVWFPAAFDEYGQRAIRDHVRDLIDVAEEEAAHFSCNAVVLDRDIVLPEGAPKLVKSLRERGFNCHPLPMTRIPESRRRLQMPDDVHAAAGDGLTTVVRRRVDSADCVILTARASPQLALDFA